MRRDSWFYFWAVIAVSLVFLAKGVEKTIF
jgi:hypothetical protein